MKIAVTGGSGFIGTRLCENLLEKAHNVRIIDKNPSKKYPHLVSIADVRDKDKLTEALEGEECIIHLAAEHKDNISPVSLYYDVNVEGTKNVISAAISNNIKKIIFTSSVAVYGLNRDEPTEEDAVDPFGDYGKSKWLAEEELRKWQIGDKGRSLAIIRPVVVFGEDNRGNVYNLLKQITSGRFIMIGDGMNKKSMAYVGNVAAFIARQIENDAGYFLYNYADKPDMTMKELVTLVNGIMGKKNSRFSIPFRLGIAGGYLFDFIALISGRELPISSVRVKKFCATTSFSARKAYAGGFKPLSPLNESLEKTIRYEFFGK